MAAAGAAAEAGGAAGAGTPAAVATGGYTYHFMGPGSGPVQQTVVADVSSLEAFNPDQLKEFTELVVSFLASPAETDLLALLDGFAGKHGVNVRALKNCCRGLLVVMKQALRRTLTPAQLKEDLTHLRMSAAKADVIAASWRANLVKLSASVSTTLMVNNLVDMEWKFGVTASTDELRQVGSTFLQLKLTIDKGGEAREELHMELSLPQFYEFLAQIEKAKTYVDFLAESG